MDSGPTGGADYEPPNPIFASRLSPHLLLCKSFCKASDSTTKQRDLRHLVGDATGIMPVYYKSPSAKLRTRSQSNGTYVTWSVMQPASCRFLYASVCDLHIFPVGDHRQASLRSLTTLQKFFINGMHWAADPGNPHSRAKGAPCGFQPSPA